ncbi:MAG: hypothetical protein JJW00_06965 [Sulfurimonas sp.]|nr:hypothetical protein [Sulfurimonas sp.]
MKRIAFILFSIFISAHLSSEELSLVDMQVESIKTPRKGIKNEALTQLYNPFTLDNNESKIKNIEKKSTSKIATNTNTLKTNFTHSKQELPVNFVLDAIINKSALINGKWYNLDDLLYGYRLSSVEKTVIKLTRGESKVTLSTQNKKQSLRFK